MDVSNGKNVFWNFGCGIGGILGDIMMDKMGVGNRVSIGVLLLGFFVWWGVVV